ncbi:MAG: Acetylornithine deacetylase [uncultured Solirubrobacteraceae bacterium]|uniref:Probable succinyl-diaminopimelate desuccinylase n=1 Tax=uncultured Solirubrobacteraceae bacterium TaxID=1162706 RepID=A0A6J4TNI4_9ACTN|nr:MAG: Acetylornithine deacetylase [uncultured Solirubrobacteraceae bacterium]
MAGALQYIAADAIARDVGRAVRVPSITGSERAVAAEVVAIAAELGLQAELVEFDLDALRRAPGYPGEEAPRDELVGALVTLPGRDPGAPRLALNGHIDVVAAGTEPWQRDPWSGAVAGGCVHGRGSLDMKGGLIAALHAMGALRAAGVRLPGDVVLQAVPAEEDGGLGTFAALQRDDDFAAALIPEPTELRIVCAHGGALTFTGTVRGKTAHAALRLEGVSAIDRYMPIHAALHEHERSINARPRHPLLADHPLPYPLLVGQLQAGRWSSQVPEELTFEGRLGVPVGQTLEDARAGLERAVAAAADDHGPPVQIVWSGGQFAPGETALDDPWVTLVQDAAAAELGAPPPLVGVGYGCDMRLFCARGIPCVLFGPSGIELAHAVDERVAIAGLAATARVIVRCVLAFATR